MAPAGRDADGFTEVIWDTALTVAVEAPAIDAAILFDDTGMVPARAHITGRA